MKRTAPLTRSAWWPPRPVAGERPTSSFKTRTSELSRSPFKWKPRRSKPGDHPAYKAWVKGQPCVVGGWRCHESDPHHIINGKGQQRKGMGQTAADRDCFPLCRRHHEEFHDRKGFSLGWDDAQRLAFQEDEILRLNKIWDDFIETGVLQEPQREAV